MTGFGVLAAGGRGMGVAASPGDLVPWVFVLVAGALVVGALVAWMLAYRFMGRRLRAEAALEWLLRWQELNRLERWTLLQSYTRMRDDHQRVFQRMWTRLGCRVFKEFKAVETWILVTSGDRWVRQEILQAWAPAPEPRLMRPLLLPFPMEHPHRPCTVPQLWAEALWGKLTAAACVVGSLGLLVAWLLAP